MPDAAARFVTRDRPPDDGIHRWVGVRADGTEVLVTIWPDGHGELAERIAPAIYGSALRVWGPPIPLDPAPRNFTSPVLLP